MNFFSLIERVQNIRNWENCFTVGGVVHGQDFLAPEFEPGPPLRMHLPSPGKLIGIFGVSEVFAPDVEIAAAFQDFANPQDLSKTENPDAKVPEPAATAMRMGASVFGFISFQRRRSRT
jgi:hypothetical protein